MKRAIRIILAIALIAALCSVSALAASAWTKRQEQAHALADGARAMGYGEDSPAVKVMQDYWWMESGSADVAGSYYYSARTGSYYYLTGDNTGADGGFWDGQYYWYLDPDTGYYYRFDKNGKRVQGDKALQFESYQGKKLWSGIITGVDDYVTKTEAEQVARFILSYSNGSESVTFKAQLAWCLLNCKGGGTLEKALAKFDEYNKNADLSTERGKEALAIAKDVLFRLRAEASGIENSGRVLPAEYSWMWIQGDDIRFRASAKGTDWDNSLPSPY